MGRAVEALIVVLGIAVFGPTPSEAQGAAHIRATATVVYGEALPEVGAETERRRSEILAGAGPSADRSLSTRCGLAVIRVERVPSKAHPPVPDPHRPSPPERNGLRAPVRITVAYIAN